MVRWLMLNDTLTRILEKIEMSYDSEKCLRCGTLNDPFKDKHCIKCGGSLIKQIVESLVDDKMHLVQTNKNRNKRKRKKMRR